MAADIAGLIGWETTLLALILFFQTPLFIALLSSLAGIVASFPITIMVAVSFLQVFIIVETEALARVITLIKTISPADPIVRIMIINIGFGTLLVGYPLIRSGFRFSLDLT